LGAVVVTARDQFSNVATSFNGPVTITVTTNPGGGLLSGTNPVTAVNGVASFANLAIDNFANGYVLTASASGLLDATSSVFNILAPSGTIAWQNAVSGNWSDATKWVGGVVPGASDVAAITVGGTYTVTLDVSPTVAGLVVGGSTGTQTVSAGTGSLILNGPATVNANGVLFLSNRALTGSGTLTNNGLVKLVSGTTVANTLANNGDLEVEGFVTQSGSIS